MAFDLSFSPEFFFQEGEPYDRHDLAINEEGNPISLWSAIEMLSDSELESISKVLNVQSISSEMIISQIEKVNTCSNLNSPVEVWVDKNGYIKIKVWSKTNIQN